MEERNHSLEADKINVQEIQELAKQTNFWFYRRCPHNVGALLLCFDAHALRIAAVLLCKRHVQSEPAENEIFKRIRS
ncbi:MAG: hypothetical protein WC333_00435 [Dehalococcoidia bacterium]